MQLSMDRVALLGPNQTLGAGTLASGKGGGVAAPDLLALNSRIVFDGDSITANGYGTYLDWLVTNTNRGWSTWALALSGGRLFQPEDGNVAVSGDTSAQMYARRAATAALDPKAVASLIGTNSISADVALSSIQADITNYIAYMLANGAEYVIPLTVLPRFGAYALTGPQEAVREALNAWILTLATSRVKPVDCDDLGLVSGDFYDDLHIGVSGAFKIGQAVAAVLDAITDTTDGFTGWTNAYSPNPTMTGTGGSLDTATGVAADGFTINAASAGGATVVGSKETIDGRAWQVITLSGNYNGSSRFVNFSPFAATALVAGDYPEMIAEIEVESLSNVLRISPIVFVWDASFVNLVQCEGLAIYEQTDHPDDVTRQVIRTPVRAIAAGTPAWQTFGFAITFKDVGVSTPISGIIRISRNIGRKVPVSA